MKLTKTQQKVLDHLAEHSTFLHFMPYRGRFNKTAYYFASATLKHFRADTVQRLITLGLLERYDEEWSGYKVKLK